MNVHRINLFVALVLLTHHVATAQLREAVEVTKIWDQAEHSAFTDLIFFKGNFYCSFREGTGHVPGKSGKDGTVRILKSKDAKKWRSVAHLKLEGIDLRDPKLSVTPDGRLMVMMGGSRYEQTELKGRTPQVSFSNKSGNRFSGPRAVVIDPSVVSWGDWLWRVTWHNGIGYTVDYQIGPEERRGPTATYLLKTADGVHFSKVSPIELDGFPNEATIRFDENDVMHVLIRRETADQRGVLATSRPPYEQWEFQKLDFRLGGPNFVFMEDGSMILGTRVYGDQVHTALFVGDKTTGFRKAIRFPSSGDNSYPGLLIRDDTLWVSYYSSHEGKSAIYLARVPLSTLTP